LANSGKSKEKDAMVYIWDTIEDTARLFAERMVQYCTVRDAQGVPLGKLAVYQVLEALNQPGKAGATVGELLQGSQAGGTTKEVDIPSKISVTSADAHAVLDSAPSGLLVVDAKDRLRLANCRALELLSLDPDEVMGMPLSFCIKDGDILRMVLAGEEFRGKPLRHDQGSFWVSCSSLPEEPGARVLVVHQMEEMQRQWDEMKQLGDELTSLLDNSYDGIIIADHHQILRVNASFGRITGLAPTQLIGKEISDLDAERHICLAAAQEVIRLSRFHKKSITVRRSLKSGNEIFVTGSPVFDRHEQVSRVVLNVRDITELNRLEDQIKKITVIYPNDDRRDTDRHEALQEIVAESPAMQRLLDLVIRVSQVDSTVLLHGESGVGKDVMARLIHRLSTRNEKPFVSVNCGAIPESLLESEFFGYEKGAFTSASRGGKPGLFEQSNSGILFLDEVGELPLNLQVKLLRVIQERRCRRLGGVRNIKLDVRILAATNRDLREQVAKGLFREDLFYRLYVVPIEIAPIRERREDILPLALTFLNHFNDKYGVTRTLGHELMSILESHDWPGNVRELQNVVERMVVTADAEVLEARHLPGTIYREEEGWSSLLPSGDLNLTRAREALERRMIQMALTKTGNTRDAAKLLGVNHSTVVRKSQRLGINLKKAAEQAEAE
jgi:PAS domain S-box-containing protein